MAANLALKELRERQGLTQSGLARRLGISRGTVSQWESGASKISSARLEQLSDIFNVDISRLTQSTASCSATRFLRNRDKKNEKNEGKYLK